MKSKKLEEFSKKLHKAIRSRAVRADTPTKMDGGVGLGDGLPMTKKKPPKK